MITRTWQPKDLRKAFFPVGLCPVSWTDINGEKHNVPGSRAVIDMEKRTVLSIVSDKYVLLPNAMAVDVADYVIRAVFPGRTLDDFTCFNIHMPLTRSSCRIDLIIPHDFYSPFGDQHEDWTPFLRISNSYNKTLTLRYEIGFCRSICLNGVIFGKKSITFSMNHLFTLETTKIDRFIEKTRHEIGDIDSLWLEVKERLNALRRIEIPATLILPMFCRAFKINVTEEIVKDYQTDSLAAKAAQILDSGRQYFDDLGNNAYALLNVLTDFASFPEGVGRPDRFIHGYQRKVGDWADELLAESKIDGFSLDKFIGKKAMDSASFMRTLVTEAGN